MPGSSLEAVKEELVREGNWAGELQEKTKDGRVLTVQSQLQLDASEDQRLVLEIVRETDKA